MAKKAFNAGQLIPTSSTPPSNAGFYRIDKNTIGVVGNMVQKNAQTNAESNVASGANLAAELAALGVSRAPTILDAADIASRPPRLWPQDSVPIKLFCSDGQYAYGNDDAQNIIKRVNVTTMEQSSGHNFGSGFVIEEVFSGHGIILAAVLETSGGRSKLYRSADNGLTFTAVHNIGLKSDGVTHSPNVTILMRGLSFGECAGRKAIVFSAYGDGVTGDEIYVAASYDNGLTWKQLNFWNLTATVNTRHGHVVKYDPYRKQWLFSFGDTNQHSALFSWDGLSPWPGDVAHSVLATTPGFVVLQNAQRYRAVDILITADWLYSFTDTISGLDGGIWRFKPNLTEFHKVNHSVYKKYHDGWCGLQADDGTLIWMDSCRADTTSDDQRYIGVYASKDGNRWFDVGRFALTGTSVKVPRGLFNAGGKVWISVTSEAGKSTYQTTAYRLAGKFREERPDNLGPCYYVDFSNGNNSNDGWSQAGAWKELRNIFATSGKLTPGARVVVSVGTSVENGISTIDYSANASPANDTSRHIQISGQGKDATKVTVSGATQGWSDASTTKTWNIEFCAMTIEQSDPTKTLFWGPATVSVTPSVWTLRDARVGNSLTGCSRVFHLRATDLVSYRSEITQIIDSTKYTLYVEGTANATLYASRLYGGRALQAADGKISIQHCEMQSFANTGIAMLSGCTRPMEVKNSVFSDSGQAPLANSSATTVTEAEIFGNLYCNDNGAGIPLPLLFSQSGAVDRNPTTLTPYTWSTMLGKCSPIGVKWDFNGNPFRLAPAVGSVEASD